MMRRPDPVDRSGRESDLLTDAQLAMRWQLSRGTLANQRSQGRGPAYLKLAGRVRYRRSDIEAYEQAGFVSREPAGITSFGDPSDVRETVERLIRSFGS
jgi:predicted DNA-binding transcriptional regulator AlpA